MIFYRDERKTYHDVEEVLEDRGGLEVREAHVDEDREAGEAVPFFSL